MAALLPGGCWGSPAWGQRPPRDRDASGRRPAGGPGRAPRGGLLWSGLAGATAGRRPGSGRRGAAGRRAHPVPYLAWLFPRRGPAGGAAGCSEPGRGGCDARGAETRDGAGAGGRTMRPTEARAARVGQGGARVAECVCVRLSVNADSLQPIGRAPPARPALRRRPLAGLNTKAPARPALRVGSGVRARGKRKASATSRLGDLSVLSSSPAHARPAQGP